MTDILIPYSFVPGTKAKAGEVNANFNALAAVIDENKSLAGQAEEQLSGAIETLQTLMEGKAGQDELDQLSQTVSQQVLPDFSNIDSNIDFVNESWRSGTSWYLKSKNGLVIQGGISTAGEGNQNINLHVPVTTGVYAGCSGQTSGYTSNGWNYAIFNSGSQIRITKTSHAAYWIAIGFN